MSYKVRVRPTMIIATRNSQKRQEDTTYRKVPTRSTPNGLLSPNAERKLKHAIRWLIACSPEKVCYEKKHKGKIPYRVNLATFTFKENMQDDSFARQLLGMWLEMAYHRFSLERYVWRAETQERGAIHFHLVTGQYMPYKEVLYTWNRLLVKNGLQRTSNAGTDIHAVHSVGNLEAYLTKYLMSNDKQSERRPINGRLWSCDHKLSQAGKEYLHLDDEEACALRFELQSYSLQNKISHYPKFLEFNDVFVGIEELWKQGNDNELTQLYRKELDKLKPTLKQKQLFPILE